MGRILVEACSNNSYGIRLVAGTEQRQSSLLGTDAGEVAGVGRLNVPIVSTLEAVDGGCDVVIDFTHPQATLSHLAFCRERGIRMIIGTTGFDGQQRKEISEAAKDIALVFAPNMSVGVNLCLKLLDLTARVLGEESDIEVIEAHHRHKVDGHVCRRRGARGNHSQGLQSHDLCPWSGTGRCLDHE
jgi:4-hydroxy-tetrahydrodipicolinate reductase